MTPSTNATDSVVTIASGALLTSSTNGIIGIGNRASVTNNGEIISADVGVLLADIDNTLINYGTISSTGRIGASVEFRGTIKNFGTITGTERGVNFSFDQGYLEKILGADFFEITNAADGTGGIDPNDDTLTGWPTFEGLRLT